MLLTSLITITSLLSQPTNRFRCDISHATLSLPSSQTVLSAPSGPPSFIAAAIGVQNYTCNAATGKYASAGAVAELFDISCLYGTSAFQDIQNKMYDGWSQLPASVTIQDVIKRLGDAPMVLGQHYFIPNPRTGGSAIAPKWDFTSASEKGNENAYMIGAVSGDLPAPTGAGDVDWLLLNKVEGQLANSIYRVDTKSGEPPAQCTAGSPLLSVKYAAKYWFFGGSVEY